MSYSISRDAIVSALETCAPITNQKHVNQAFSRVRVALNHEFRFTATDAVQTVCGSRALVATGPDAEGAVDCAALLDAARRMPEGDVTLKLKEEVLELKSGKRSYKAVYLAADSLPAAPERPKRRFSIIHGAALATVVGRVRWAMCDEKYPHDGIRIVLRDRELRAQTVHNHHVAEAVVALESQAEIVDTVIPPGLVPSLVAACADGDVGILDDGAALWLDAPTGLFRYLSATDRCIRDELVSRVLAGDGAAVTLASEALASALKYVSMAAGREAPRVRVEARAGSLLLHAIDGQREATDSVECDTPEPFSFEVSPRHFISAVEAAGKKTTVIVRTLMDPILVRGDGFRCCVMGLHPRSI